MEGDEQPKIAVVGAGLAGSLMATYLGESGYDVDVYEKRADLRTADIGPGKSINLALSARGIDALNRVELAKRVLDDAIPMRGRMLHAVDGTLTFQPYSKNPEDAINSVSRATLNITMLNAAERCPHVRMHFEHKCLAVGFDAGTLDVIDAGNGEHRSIRADIIIGADGAFSAVRRGMQTMDRFDYRQDYLTHGFKELTIPADPNGQHRMEKNALHIWPRRSFMMIALPNQNGTFTCTLFWPFDGDVSFDALETPEDIDRFFKTQFPDALPLMPTLIEDYQRNPVSSLVTVRCGPWHVAGKAVLIGDAAHAIVPFYGQGINAGFEDCIVLKECMDAHRPNWQRAFESYYAKRKKHADTIATLATDHFIEMRDDAASPAFLRKKRRERRLDRLFPNYLPLYSMISFSRIPYADAVERAREQDRTVRRILWTAVAILVIIVAASAWWAL